MPVRDPKTTLGPTATPDTLSDIASKADLGPVDSNQALMIKFCEAKVENKYLPIVGELKGKVNTLRTQYIGVLRELREKIQAVRFEDFLKVVLGVLVAFLVRSVGQKGTEAITDFWTLIEFFLFIFCLGFLAVRHIQPTTRKREIEKELKQIETEVKQ